ncbi:MAG: hypothetical protein AAFQ40_05070 [Cyanobacteria bacterium J06623_5]
MNNIPEALTLNPSPRGKGTLNPLPEGEGEGKGGSNVDSGEILICASLSSHILLPQLSRKDLLGWMRLFWG